MLPWYHSKMSHFCWGESDVILKTVYPVFLSYSSNISVPAIGHTGHTNPGGPTDSQNISHSTHPYLCACHSGGTLEHDVCLCQVIISQRRAPPLYSNCQKVKLKKNMTCIPSSFKQNSQVHKK